MSLELIITIIAIILIIILVIMKNSTSSESLTTKLVRLLGIETKKSEHFQNEVTPSNRLDNLYAIIETGFPLINMNSVNEKLKTYLPGVTVKDIFDKYKSSNFEGYTDDEKIQLLISLLGGIDIGMYKNRGGFLTPHIPNLYLMNINASNNTNKLDMLLSIILLMQFTGNLMYSLPFMKLIINATLKAGTTPISSDITSFKLILDDKYDTDKIIKIYYQTNLNSDKGSVFELTNNTLNLVMSKKCMEDNLCYITFDPNIFITNILSDDNKLDMANYNKVTFDDYNKLLEFEFIQTLYVMNNVDYIKYATREAYKRSAPTATSFTKPTPDYPTEYNKFKSDYTTLFDSIVTSTGLTTMFSQSKPLTDLT